MLHIRYRRVRINCTNKLCYNPSRTLIYLIGPFSAGPFLTLFRGGYFTIAFRGGMVNLPELSFLGRNFAMDTKLGSITNLHKIFRFPSKNIHNSDDVIRFCWWHHHNRRFWRIFRSSGKMFTVTWVLIGWSWLTPHFKAKRCHYNLNL